MQSQNGVLWLGQQIQWRLRLRILIGHTSFNLRLYIHCLHKFETWFRTDVNALATCSFWVLIMVSSTISASGQCVGWTLRKIVFTVRILFYQLKERSHFSLKKKLVISIPSLYIMLTFICLCTIYFRFLLLQYFLLSPL